MKKILVIMGLFLILLGVTVIDAAATEIVILMCQEDVLQVPVTKVNIVACSKSSGVTRACPTNPNASCAQVLANYLSDGLLIRNVQLFSNNGVIYTLVRP